MENYEFLRRKKEIIRDEVYRLVETITTKYNEEVGDIGEIDPITKVGLGRDFNACIYNTTCFKKWLSSKCSRLCRTIYLTSIFS